jgi:AcrR family transcriptional regulator
MAAALECFSRKGFHGTSMREIAAAADVSLGNIYNYFSSKGELLMEILRHANAAQMRATQAAIAGAGEKARERLAAAVRAFAMFVIAEQAACFVANSELHYLDDEDRRLVIIERDRHQAVFQRLIEEGVAASEFLTPHPEGAARAVLTMCNGITVWYHPDGPLSAEDIAERYSRYALALLEAL